MQDQYLQSVVSAQKDVEGLNHQFLFNLYHKCVLSHKMPCQPIGSQMLASYRPPAIWDPRRYELY